jgi:hypothetical protein
MKTRLESDDLGMLRDRLRRSFTVDDRGADALLAGLGRTPTDAADALRVYLDQNHWIYLAKAASGHPEGAPFEHCLELLKEAVSRGLVVVPLSATHYMELAIVMDVRQRADVANVMAEISRFRTLADHNARMACEFDAALHARRGRPAFPRKLQEIGTGLAFQSGQVEGPSGRLVWAEGAEPPLDSEGWFEDLEHISNQVMEYLVLRGPSPEEAARIPGYDPMAAQRVAEGRAELEQDLMRQLDEEPQYRHQLDDLVHARYLVWEVRDKLPALLWRSGMSMDSFFLKDKEWIAALLDDIPCLAVKMALTLQTNRNGNRAWSPNDIHDLDGLSAAVPYCDVVVTEKYACEVMHQSGLADRYGTTVIRRLSDLEPVLVRRMQGGG